MSATQSIILTVVFSAWGVVTVVLALLVCYRALLSSREDDQIFIDPAEQHHYQEQQQIIAKMSRLKGPIIALSAASTVLLLSGVGYWVYVGFKIS
jgi:hypothetical protein